MKNIFALGIVFGLVGCVSPSYNAQPIITNISKPPLNSINKVGVGEKMLTQGSIYEDDGLIVNSSTKISGYIIR